MSNNIHSSQGSCQCKCYLWTTNHTSGHSQYLCAMHNRMAYHLAFHFRFSLSLLLCFTLFIHSGRSQLQHEQLPDSLQAMSPIQELDEVVVSAFNRSQHLLQTPASLTYIGGVLQSREQPALNLLPVLQYAPGVFAHDGANNTNRVTIRGIGARVPYATGKIRAYFNNIPITNGSGESFLQDIDPALIQHILVIKGPAPSNYGAGLGGTIIMQAREPQLRRSGISNHLQAGSFGLFRNTTMADLVGEKSAISLAYSHTQSEGYRENNQLRRNALSLVSQHQGGWIDESTALFSFLSLKSHIPSSIDSLSFVHDPQSAAANWLKTKGYEASKRMLTGINLTKKAGADFSLQWSAFTIYHDEKEMRPFDVFYQQRFTYGSRFKAEKTIIVNNVRLEVHAGGELFLEDYQYSNYENIEGLGVQGAKMSDHSEALLSSNLFVQTDLDYANWSISAGINLNQYRRKYEDLLQGPSENTTTYQYPAILSPRISLGYAYRPKQLVYATLSHGFAPPSLAETLDADGKVNPDIQAEKSWNTEFGIRGQTFGNRFFYDLSLYRMQVQDLLVAERIGENAWIGKNAGESLHHGLEAEIHWVLAQQLVSRYFKWQEIALRANYSYHHFRFTDFIDRDQDFSGNKIPGIPEQVIYASLYAALSNGLHAQTGLRFVGPMTMNDANSRFTDTYHVADASLGYQRYLSNRWNIKISFRVNNLFNAHYASMILVNAPSFGNTSPRYYYPGLPRHYSFGLRIGYR